MLAVLITSFLLMGLWATTSGLHYIGPEGRKGGEFLGLSLTVAMLLVLLVVVSRFGFERILQYCLLCASLFILGAIYGLLGLKVSI
jgi:hypothetical protein